MFAQGLRRTNGVRLGLQLRPASDNGARGRGGRADEKSGGAIDVLPGTLSQYLLRAICLLRATAWSQNSYRLRPRRVSAELQ